MALKPVLILVFVAILAISFAEAQGRLGITLVNGTLYCTANGSPRANPNTTPVFSNARVQVVCSPNVVSTTPSNATSNANGMYRVTIVPWSNATASSVASACRLFVLTPLSNCNSTLPSTELVSNIQFVKTEVFGTFLLRFSYFVATGFRRRA